ncbi:MAG: DinB family protein [Nocardioidaceae bacterium]
MASTDEAERVDLLAFLQAQRRSVAAIVEGLDRGGIRQSVVPSRWTPLSLLQHLAHAEYFWFEQILAASSGPPDWSSVHTDTAGAACAADDYELQAALAVYRHQCARSDTNLAAARLDSRPVGRIPPDMPTEIHDVRTIVLHMIEETSRHAGHLDIARELIDGVTGLGPR